VKDAVLGACEMLGFDPLYVANEGKMVAIVAKEDAGKILKAMQKHRYGHDAAIIGEVVADHPGRVVMKTLLGSSRIVDMLVATFCRGFAESARTVDYPEYAGDCAAAGGKKPRLIRSRKLT